jgi:MOSC domain-containing protein YiiM
MGEMRVISVNVAAAAPMRIGDRTVWSAIAKRPVAGAVAVTRLGLAGDEQADRSVHGGLDKAIYAYSTRHHGFWQTVRAQARVAAASDPLPPGLFGENLTVETFDEAQLWIGDRLCLPGCTLAVSAPRMPCDKFGAAIGFTQAVKLMMRSGYCGAYLSVLEPGTLSAADAITIQPGPREVNLRELFMSRARGR